eukprot:CAMPEP_0201506418 /NCGR_PEP_ID=MMETSP0161_2-20130828/321_1 /ASSEMBLY_ACC=CAM_ASM_000251 /TAXON_ID=180227 /ORGANISM="Neoparamoeba aestuarina, Strain SoJaBio B1-5/56/2" /LENGTH=124 /DNA_ID=CAMNT_0047900493 /DNA_START=243 /DNA_END=617 /DNA_ORIENTATION=+
MGVIFQTKIDVFFDSESEVSGCGEVAGLQFVFFDLEPLLEDFHGLLSTDGAGNGDLLISADTETTDGQAGFGLNRVLASELLEHLVGVSKAIAGLTNGDVQAKLGDTHLAHRVFGLGGSLKKKG